MIINCEKCNARYDINVTNVKKPTIKVRCAQCNHSFKVDVKPKAEPAPDIVFETVDEPGQDQAAANKFFEKAPASPAKEGAEHAAHKRLVISISNQKGGVAKTSTCINLGTAFAAMGKKVLLIDFDVQANLTTIMNLASDLPSFYDIMESEAQELDGYIWQTAVPNLSVLPANGKLALLAKKFMHTANFEYMLRDCLQHLGDKYDYVLIDTPPAIGYSTLNALMASDHVIIPTPCEYLSMHGIHKIEEVIQIIQRRTQRYIGYNILITMYDSSSVASQVIYKKIRDIFKNRVFNTVVEQDEKIRESQIMHQPVQAYDQQSSSAQQYMELALEFMDQIS